MTTIALFRLAGLVLLISGCSTAAATLHPAPRANKVQGLRAAAEETDGEAQIIVQATAWPGDASSKQAATPLRVTVNNSGGDPLRIGYDDFVLQGTSRAYKALPPGQIEGSEPSDRAMREGIVQPGDSISGYIYFERVDDDEKDVQFRAHIDSAESGMEVVNVSIPFMVLE